MKPIRGRFPSVFFAPFTGAEVRCIGERLGMRDKVMNSYNPKNVADERTLKLEAME